MTNDLAIRILTGDVLGTTEQTQEAVKIAVEALSKPDVADINVGNTEITEEAVKEYCRKRCLTILTNDYLYELTSAQTEIVRCKDCKWKQGSECVRFADVRPWPDDFCSRAERREE